MDHNTLSNIERWLSTLRRYITLIVNINRHSVYSYKVLYNITVVMLLGVLVISIVSIILYIINNIIIYNSDVSIILSIIDNITIILDYSDYSGRSLSKGDLLGFMISSISIIVGFYGIITQIYVGEWSPTIFLRRPFIVIYTGRNRNNIHGNNIFKYIKLLLNTLFPEKNQTLVITYDQAIILILLLAMLHLAVVIIVGDISLIPINIVMFIFMLLLASSVTLTWLSTMIKPPLSMQVTIMEDNIPLKYLKTNIFLRKLGIYSLVNKYCYSRTCTYKNISTYIMIIIYIIIGILLYLNDSPTLINNLSSDRAMIMKNIIYIVANIVTIFVMIILLGLLNSRIGWRLYTGFVGFFVDRLNNYFSYFILFIILAILIIFYYIKYILNDILFIINFIIGLIVSLIIVGFVISVVSRRGAIGFGDYTNYAVRLLSMMRQGPSRFGPTLSQIVNELLAAETLLAMSITSAALLKKLKEDVGDPDNVKFRYNNKAINMRNPHEYPSRFYVSIDELDRYFTHVESLASVVREMLSEPGMGVGRGRGEVRSIDAALVRSVIMAGQGLLAAGFIGRTGVHSYPRALLEVVRVLLRVRLHGYRVDEELLGEIESVLPDLLVEFMDVSKAARGSLCSVDVAEDLLYSCIYEAPNDKYRSYCCLLAHILLGECIEELSDNDDAREVIAKCGLLELRRSLDSNGIARLCRGKDSDRVFIGDCLIGL